MPIFSNEALKDRHIIVTGASGGIGKAIVDVIVDMGAKVTATGRNVEKLNEYFGSNPNVNIFPLDIDQTDQHENFLQQAISTFGNVYGLVNNAGTYERGPAEKLEAETFSKIMHTNWFATVLLTQKVYRHMISNQTGAIVNIASLSGLRGVRNNSAYVSSKFALVGFTQSLALEAIHHGIRVNAVCPGFVNTKMGVDAIRDRALQNGISYEEQVERLKREIPAGKIIEPYEVANVTAFLLTDAAYSIVGESIKISGGTVV